MHDNADVPEDGLLPTLAEHIKLMVNPVPVNVTVLLVYAEVGLTPVAAGAALMVNCCALLGPSIISNAVDIVVTAAFDVDPDVPYLTDGILQRNVDEAGWECVPMTMVSLPEAILAVPVPRPPPHVIT
jgi:hypothetical protein